jgi:uncharacterized membrane protein
LVQFLLSFLRGLYKVYFIMMLIVSIGVIFASVKSNNSWGVAVGLVLLLLSPLIDKEN